MFHRFVGSLSFYIMLLAVWLLFNFIMLMAILLSKEEETFYQAWRYLMKKEEKFIFFVCMIFFLIPSICACFSLIRCKLVSNQKKSLKK